MFNKKKKSNENTSKYTNVKNDDIKLILYYNKSGEVTSNFFQWRELWQMTKLGSYGDEYINQFDEQVVYEFDLDNKLQDLSIEEEHDTSMSAWLPTEEEKNVIRALPNKMEQDWKIKELYLQWSAVRKAENTMIKN